MLQSDPAGFLNRRPIGIFFPQDATRIQDIPIVKKLIGRKRVFEKYGGQQIIEETLEELAEVLRQEERWEIRNKPRERVLALPEGVKETNREHVLGMLSLLDQHFRGVFRFGDPVKIILAILVHDIGEYRIHDIAKSHPNADKLKRVRKKYEYKIASILISNIKNKALKEDSQKALDAYFNFSTETEQIDFEILVVKLLDRLQGIRFGLELVFHGNMEPGKKENTLNDIRRSFKEFEKLRKLFWNEMNRIMDASDNIFSTGQYVMYPDLIKGFVKENYDLDLDE
ncbi:MAG: HD domain-containing protein [Candidatus Gracilibacteria bacterium]|nr:HD domain-containing protein [Candidatus Gracilibacteria bacterium]